MEFGIQRADTASAKEVISPSSPIRLAVLRFSQSK
jgi:hypothetical protein